MKVIQTLRSLDRESKMSLALVLFLSYIILGTVVYLFGCFVNQEFNPTLWYYPTKVEAVVVFFIMTFIVDVMAYYTIKKTQLKE